MRKCSIDPLRLVEIVTMAEQAFKQGTSDGERSEWRRANSDRLRIRLTLGCELRDFDAFVVFHKGPYYSFPKLHCINQNVVEQGYYKL